MKKKYTVIILFLLLISFQINAQTVEKLFDLADIKLTGMSIVSVFPETILIDETDDLIIFPNYYRDESISISLSDGQKIIDGHQVGGMSGLVYKPVEDYILGFSDCGIFIQKDGKEIFNKHEGIANGISFILKKDSGYIIYYVNEDGTPGAVDTTGRVYSNREAVNYLQEYDKDKFEESRQRAQELGLLKQFDRAAVLVWGKTYYSTVKILEKFWGKCPYVNYSNPIQYDEQGNGYQSYFDGNWGSIISSADTNGQRFFCLENVNEYSDILKGKSEYYMEHQGEAEPFNDFSASMYVGFGGNIYYYIAGASYTEVFRIRRTWGAPDFYAMAVNGWTDDGYGRYADEVLSKLSKADLRLLRNTVYALYGYHFNSGDLASRFDKEVWYTDKGLTLDHIQLPEHRQRLVEKIQGLEAGK